MFSLLSAVTLHPPPLMDGPDRVTLMVFFPHTEPSELMKLTSDGVNESTPLYPSPCNSSQRFIPPPATALPTLGLEGAG